jgi:enolase
VVSHGSGETIDSFISDLAIGVGADLIKADAPYDEEHMSEYNQVLFLSLP